jgi:hypothetical protein
MFPVTLPVTLPMRLPTKFDSVVIDPLAMINPPTVTLPVADILLAVTLSSTGMLLPSMPYRPDVLFGGMVGII